MAPLSNNMPEFILLIFHAWMVSSPDLGQNVFLETSQLPPNIRTDSCPPCYPLINGSCLTAASSSEYMLSYKLPVARSSRNHLENLVICRLYDFMGDVELCHLEISCCLSSLFPDEYGLSVYE